MIVMLAVALAWDTAEPAPPLPLVEANAGEDFMAYVGQTVELNGTGFGDGELGYRWERVSGPPVELSDPDVANPQFVPEVAGTYTFDLVVTSDGETSLPDEVSVAIVRTDVGTVRSGRCATGAAGVGWLGLLALVAVRRQTAS